ncbi:MAG TPA: histone deacetylase [Candidatus Krumholzibacteria bacterium]|nr:histone deacetylase [Candidatus Krumholzibacteria bacterium]
MTTGFHIDERYLRHRNPEGHPEHGGRIEALLELAHRSSELGVKVMASQRAAARDELALVHTEEYVDAIASTANRALMLDPDTFTAPESYDVARHAAGALLDLVDRAVAGEITNAFAAVRPPGHHAETERAMGFCLFNNVALAAAYALKHHNMERVLVVDWDVHHGNGTQEIFWSDPRVLFISLHQYPFYPGTGRADDVGDGDGRGFTVNVPMPGGFGDAEWLAAFHRVVEPIAHQYQPQLVLVSAGFDAHGDDPLGGMRVTETGFAAMADSVLAIAREHANGRVIAALEGGYDVDALSRSVEAVLRRLTCAEGRPTHGAGGAEPGPPRVTSPRGGEVTGPAPVEEPPATRDDDRFGQVFAQIKAAQSAYWKL